MNNIPLFLLSPNNIKLQIKKTTAVGNYFDSSIASFSKVIKTLLEQDKVLVLNGFFYKISPQIKFFFY